MKEPHADHHRFIEAGFRQGDESRVLELYQTYARQLVLWIQNNNGTEADAEELFQESMHALVVKASDPDFVLTCPIGAFLYSIWYNKWMKALKNRKRGHKLQISTLDAYQGQMPADQLVETTLAELECLKILDGTFKQLSNLCQQLLLLIKQGKTVKEMIATLQMEKDSTLYRRKNACVSRWHELLSEKPEFEDCKTLLL